MKGLLIRMLWMFEHIYAAGQKVSLLFMLFIGGANVWGVVSLCVMGGGLIVWGLLGGVESVGDGIHRLVRKLLVGLSG